MSVISVRVSRDLKERMSKVQENWADYIRRMIERRIKEHEMLEASRRIDKIRSKTRMNVYHAAKTIREDRDKA
jgi:predicted DNA-binding protein